MELDNFDYALDVPTHTLHLIQSTVTYFPGDLTNYDSTLGLTLSTGLAGARLTTGGQRVQYTDGSGGQSSATFHSLADGATVIPHASDGGWYYTSNSESSSGGVGAIRFNAAGQVIGYERILTGTSRNCGGGRTYWGTWVTCEENGSSGRLYEVDPNTGYTAQINAVDEGGNFESFAYDDLDPVSPRFFTVRFSDNSSCQVKTGKGSLSLLFSFSFAH